MLLQVLISIYSMLLTEKCIITVIPQGCQTMLAPFIVNVKLSENKKSSMHSLISTIQLMQK